MKIAFLPLFLIPSLVFAAIVPTPITGLKLLSDGNANDNSITNAATLEADDLVAGDSITLNGDTITEWPTAGGSILNSSNYVNKIGVQIYPASGGTNFWWDFGLTNNSGPITYQTITATNNVNFLGPTNMTQWGLISINVIASGANRTISLPTNLPHLNTNGLTLTGSRYALSLTNGNEFRITIQTNVTLSTLWTTFGQGYAGFTNVFSAPTNGPANGYTIVATGNDSKWVSPMNVTNGQTTGYILYASGTSNAYWGAPPVGGGGSNSVTQSLFEYPETYISGAGNYDHYLFFAFFGNVLGSTWASDGVKTLRVSVPVNGWVSTSTSQFETHQFLLLGSGTNATPLSFDGGIFLDGPAPAVLQTNQTYLITVYHKYGQTNWLGKASSVTNYNAFRN